MSNGTRTNHRTSIVKSTYIEYRNGDTMHVVDTAFNTQPTEHELVERATQLAILHDSPVDILEIVEKVCVECGEICFRSEEWFFTVEPIMEEEAPSVRQTVEATAKLIGHSVEETLNMFPDMRKALEETVHVTVTDPVVWFN